MPSTWEENIYGELVALFNAPEKVDCNMFKWNKCTFYSMEDGVTSRKSTPVETFLVQKFEEDK